MECDKCFLRDSAKAPVPGEGSTKAKVILIGEAPGRVENSIGRPFVGPAGKLLDFIIRKLGLDRKDFYITNVLKCMPKRDKLPSGEKLTECLIACKKHLENELQQFGKSTIIVLLGSTALRAFTGNSVISKYAGLEVQPRVWCAYHPAFALRRAVKELDIYRTLYHACRQAKMKSKPQKDSWYAFREKSI